MKFIKLIFVSSTLMLSCGNENNKVCNTDNPLEELGWLNEIRSRFDMDMGPQRQRITQYKYDGKYVFKIEDCYQCADALTYVYNCEGEIICEFGGLDGVNTCPDFEQNATDEKILYDG